MTDLRKMYDSVTVPDIPADATLVGSYIDGIFADYADVKKRCPKARIVTITVKGSLDAMVADVESGDLTPEQGAQWALAKIKKGDLPTIYCGLAAWPTVKAAVAKVGMTGRVSYWVAEYGSNPEVGSAPEVPAGAVAKQYRSTKKPNLDTSVVLPFWPGVDPAPAKAPTKAPAKKAPAKILPAPAPAKSTPAPKVPAKVPPKVEPKPAPVVAAPVPVTTVSAPVSTLPPVTKTVVPAPVVRLPWWMKLENWLQSLFRRDE